jgi:universal stress protein A
MFKRILLPIDLTDKHGPALETAARLAEQSGGELVLLHVIEVIAGLVVEELRDFYNRLEKVARAHLTRLGAHLQDRNLRWHAEVLCGHRVPEVVRFAADSGADLIVLTAPRPDPNHPTASWGSLSFKITIMSQCPVLVVK